MQDLSKSSFIKDIITRASEIRDNVIVIKLSSVIIENDALLTNFVENIKLLSICGSKIVIIHDYTTLVEETLKLFGFDGLINIPQISNDKRNQVIEMVLSGHINKLIASKLSNQGCCAIGISGKDGNLIQAKGSKLSWKKDSNLIINAPIINNEILLSFEDSNIIPVISPIATDENDQTHLLDVNLTTSVIASSLGADHLILPKDDSVSYEKDIVINDVYILKQIMDINKSSSLLKSAFYALENNTEHVHLVNPTINDSIIFSLFKSHLH